MGQRAQTGKTSPEFREDAGDPVQPQGWDPSDRDETVRVSALDEQELARPDPNVALSLHRRVAAKFLADGALHRAFTELMHGAQTLSITGDYASELINLARRTGMELAAAAALESAVKRAEPGHQPDVRRRLARLLGRIGRYAQARNHLREALAGRPDDWRVRHTLVAIATDEGNFELAAAELASIATECERCERYRAAARNALARARLLDESLADPTGAAAAWEQAARNAAKGGDAAAAFSARVLVARALVGAKAPHEQIEAALRELADAGQKADREREATRIAAELARSAGAGQARTLALLAEAAQARGAWQEAGALLKAAVEADPANAALATRLESFFIGRGNWVELATLYRERAQRESNPQVRAELLGRLAEVLEDELSDRTSAAEVYGAIVESSGDPAALAAQIRLLTAATDPVSVQQALDAAVRSASEPRARLEALLLRGEALLAMRQLERAAADFEAAAAAAPDNVRALAGLAECRTDAAAVERFAKAYAALPRGVPTRAALARRLARLLEWPLGDGARARAIWGDVLAESPGDGEAEGRLIDLARSAGDRADLVNLLRRRLAREPRGNPARAARHELAACLEAMGRADEALDEWRNAARTEPGDAIALVAIADRCEARGLLTDAAFALEGAAAATEPGPERAALWLRLARLSRERLGDPGHAAVCEERARQASAPQPANAEARASAGTAAQAPEEATSPGSLGGSPTELEIEITTGEILETIEDFEPPAARRETSETVSTAKRPGMDDAAVPPPPPAAARRSVRRRTAEYASLLAEIERAPLDAGGYRALAEAYERAHDPGRSAQMEEIANALDGDPLAEPLSPKFTLSQGDWAGLRHPELRASATELFGLTGAALCAIEAQELKQAGARRPFAMAESRGAQATADALLGAVRVLGIRSPDVYLASSDSAPMRAANCSPPIVLVGRSAVSKAMPAAQLRFFAGRALACFRPEMLALRLLTQKRLEACVEGLRQLVNGERPHSSEARALSRRVPVKSRERIAQLLESLQKRSISLPRVVVAARHTANRAGLVAAGGVAPAVVALRAKRGAADELAELVKFAASERYLALRSRR